VFRGGGTFEENANGETSFNTLLLDFNIEKFVRHMEQTAIQAGVETAQSWQGISKVKDFTAFKNGLVEILKTIPELEAILDRAYEHGFDVVNS